MLAYAEGDKVVMNVGFYYMANAGGRLAGTILPRPLAGGAKPASRAPAARSTMFVRKVNVIAWRRYGVIASHCPERGMT
jgi:hypothetical protein